MKKRWIAVVAILLALAIGVGVTVAYLVSSSGTLENTFSVGKVQITLTETGNRQFPLTPGVTHTKDPAVVLKAGSEAAWLFVRVEKSAGFDRYCTYEMAEGWELFPEASGVYCRAVDKTAADKPYPVLQGNRITVSEELTEQELNALTVHPTLEFTAYAVQRESVATPEEAWAILNE